MRKSLPNTTTPDVVSKVSNDEISFPRGLFIFVMGIFLFLLANTQLSGQGFQLDKTADNYTPNAGEAFNFIIDAACNNSVGDCEGAVITDPLPTSLEFIAISLPLPSGVADAVYDPSTHSIEITFDSSPANCPTCTPDGVNSDEDDFAQGSSIQLLIQVRFPDGALNGTTADNTISGTSVNAGSPFAAAPTVTSINGEIAETGCNQMHVDLRTIGDAAAGSLAWSSLVIGNKGFTDISNYEAIVDIPDNTIFEEIATPYIPGTMVFGQVSYETSANPGISNYWFDFNTGTPTFQDFYSLTLPSGARVTSITMTLGFIPADGNFNPYTYESLWDASLRVYSRLDADFVQGELINVCAEISSRVGSESCTDNVCETTEVIESGPVVVGGIQNQNISGVAQQVFSPGEQFNIELYFASDESNDTPIIGGVITDILPPGITYVSHEVAYGSFNIQDQLPVLETEFLTDGRQLVRYVWSEDFGNEFTISPIGSWVGFGIDMIVEIGYGVSSGNYANEIYYSPTGSDHECKWLGAEDTDDYLGGHSFEGEYCYDFDDLDIVIQPGSAGLESQKEVLGTKDTDYNRYPVIGQTVPGGLSNYRLTLENPNATPITNLIAVDVFPYIGDTEVLESTTPRFSEWQPVLAAPIDVPNGTIVEYSIVNNPCRDELAGPSEPTPFPTGCNDAEWSATPPEDITQVTAVRFNFGSNILSQGESFVIEWDMRAPSDAIPDGRVAWNSFGFIGSNATTDDRLLPAEPIKVGIELVPADIPFLGDFVWNDLNRNGIQNPGEPGINGVRINLFEDSNGNGIAEPDIDELYTFSVSSGGGQFLFSDFPFGADYFLEFTNFPDGFSPTNANSGGDTQIDSEPVITEVFTVTNTTNDRSRDFGLRELGGLEIIEGTVFEDINYGGGNGRTYDEANASAQGSGWSANAIGVGNVVVEIYDVDGNYISSTLTDVNGNYSFQVNAGESYQVRVVNSTVSSNRGSNSTGETIIPVQTFRADGANNIVDEVGGNSTVRIDAGVNTSDSNLSSLSSSSMTPQSVTIVDLATMTGTGVDFGYNFDTVVNTNDSGQGSLRQFILNSNELANLNLDQEDAPVNGVSFAKDPEWETSIFMIPGSGVHVINPLSALDAVDDPRTHISAYTQMGSSVGTNESRTIAVELEGNTVDFDGLSILASDVQVSGLAVNTFRKGIRSYRANSTYTHIWGNYIGTKADGVTIGANMSNGVELSNVFDSFVGTNGDENNDENEGNLISNSFGGIQLRNTANVLVANNYIGTDKNGTTALGNEFIGVFIRDAVGKNTVGFDDELPQTNVNILRNLISGNGTDGVRVNNGDDQVIAGNLIGTDITGTLAIPNNGYGIQMLGSVNNLIIGTDSDGDDDIKERNLISGNNAGLRFIVGGSGVNNKVSGNFIGTDYTGNAALPNSTHGLDINGPFGGIVIGTNGDGINDLVEGNIISGNGEDGIRVANSSNNIIAGNNIGVGYDDVTNLGNGKRGIFISRESIGNVIGYSRSFSNSNELEVGNFIKFNGDSGIAIVGTSSQNRISRNQLFDNAALGIDLLYDLVTPNDNGDGDSGPNELLNFPVFESSEIIGTDLVISGFAPAGAEIEFFIKDGLPNPNPLPAIFFTSFGEGAEYLFTAYEGGPLDEDNSIDSYVDDGTGSTTTNTQNKFRFTFDISGLSITDASLITATATNSDNSTSEFSGWTPCTLFEAELVDMDLSDCMSSNSSVTINAFGGSEPYSFDIGFGPQSSGLFTGLSTGFYTVTVTDSNNCLAETEFYVSCPVECPNTDFTELIVSCYNFGGYQGAYASNDAIVGFPSNLTSDPTINSLTEMTEYATHEEVGTVYGVAVSQSRRIVYTAAYLKRHAGFGPGGTGAIYSVDLDQLVAPSVFADLNSIYGAGTAGVNTHDFDESDTCTGGSSGFSNFACWYNDVDTWDEVGRTSLGDIDISDDEEFLYVLNLEDRRIYQIEIDNPTAAQTSFAFPLDQLTDPDVTMKPLDPIRDIRPFALKYRGNKLYVGALDSEESRTACCGEGGSVIYVYSYDLSSGEWNLELESDVQRANPPRIFKWQEDFQGNYLDENHIIVSDIEFDGADMIIGLRDISGDLFGLNTGRPIPGDESSRFYDNRVGDIVRFGYDFNTGDYTMESNATAGNQTSTGVNIGFGWPFGSESVGSYYHGDFFSTTHKQTGLGGLWIDDAENKLYSTVYNPLRVFSGGVKALDNNTGAATEAYELIGNTNIVSSFGKTNSFGDIEGFASCDFCEFFVLNTLEDSPESCVDEADGIASANPSGGETPYSFQWSNSQSTPVINGLTAGTYHVTVTDALGCELIDSVVISTVIDVTPPTFTCPIDITIACNESSDITNTGDISSVSDDCDDFDDLTIIFSDNTNVTNCVNSTIEIITRVFTVTDLNGNSSTCEQLISVVDNVVPAITDNAANLVVECDGSGNDAELQAWLDSNGGASASDICSDVVWTNDFTTLDDECGVTGTAIVTFTATDDCGNTNTTQATFTIEDTTVPTIDTPASNLNLECDDANQQAAIDAWLLSNGGANSTDVCNATAIVWTHDYAPGDENTECGATGSVLVTFTATDNCGLFSTTTATITIEDTTPPNIDVESLDETVECDGSGNDTELQAWLNSNGGASASDVCSDVVWTNNFTTISDDCGVTGSALVIFTATDDCGNATTTEATFTIEDTTDPTINTPASDLSIECDDADQQAAIDAWLLSNGGANSTDACNTTAVIWTHDYAPGDENTECGATGSVLVTFTATDNCGLFSTTSATITIEDTTPPTIDIESVDETVECDGAGNDAELQAWLDANGGASASDICGDVTWTNDFVTLTDDCGMTGMSIVTFTATDDCGNATTTQATFTIEDTTEPTIDIEASDLNLECDDANQQAAIDAWLS